MADTAMVTLDNLAIQARMFSAGAAMNLLQLGRVLCEAKALVRHGDWAEWVRVNAHMPIRTAQQYMQAFQKFGLDPEISRLGPGQIIRLLPMTEDERQELLASNDVESMTDRELREAIRRQREEIRGEVIADIRAEVSQEIRDEADRAIGEAIRQRDEARDALAEELERGVEPDREMMAKIDELQESSDHFAELARKAAAEKGEAERQLKALRAEYDEQAEIIRDQQETINGVQDELFSLKSAAARGETIRQGGGEDLTAAALNEAVGEFVAAAARMPYMHTAFAAMSDGERQKYWDCVRVVEGWLAGAREALEARAVMVG